MTSHCHKMVAEVAKASAHELYDKLMGDNLYYDEWKRQNPECSPKELERRFVAKNWGKCLDFARATLAAMLRGPYPDVLKEDILDALSKDASLRRGRRSGYKQLMH